MSYSVDELATHPGMLGVIQLLASQLRGQYDENPRLSRYMVSHQRWLMSQAAFALHLEFEAGISQEGLTTSRLRDMITSINAASRNTVLNFLDQLLSYKFIAVATESNKRPRRFEATEITTQAMAGWVGANLAALDQLDNGERLMTFMAHPEMLCLLQPRIARQCIDNLVWRNPPDCIAMFQWTESGGLVMDELMCRVDPDKRNEEKIDLGRIDARLIAENFMMSRTHLQRLLRKAVLANCLEWHDDTRKTHMYIKRGFLSEYLGWQAEKFAIISEAFEWSLAQVEK